MVSLSGVTPELIQSNSVLELIPIDPTYKKFPKKFIARLQKVELQMLYLLRRELKTFRSNSPALLKPYKFSFHGEVSYMELQPAISRCFQIFIEFVDAMLF
jgi:hypothetical protein